MITKKLTPAQKAEALANRIESIREKIAIFSIRIEQNASDGIHDAAIARDVCSLILSREKLDGMIEKLFSDPEMMRGFNNRHED